MPSASAWLLMSPSSKTALTRRLLPVPRSVAFSRASVGFTSYVPSNLSRVSTSGGLTKVCPSYL